MKVFLTGGTGVIGTRALPALVAAGHEVTAVARGDDKAAIVRRLGGTPVQVDLFDAAAVKNAVEGHQAVVHLATNIPPTSKMAWSKQWETNNRLRTEASAHLVDAALATGAERYVQESIIFPYTDAGDRWIEESAPRDTNDVFDAAAVAEEQAMRFADQRDGGIGVVLRFAQFYAPDAIHVESFHRLARWGINPFPGAPDSYASFIHADDAGAAVAAAMRAPTGIYNVADDEPLTRGEAGALVAELVGAKKSRSVPGSILGVLPAKATALTRSLRVSNRRFREATGWTPRYPSIREGWATVVSS